MKNLCLFVLILSFIPQITIGQGTFHIGSGATVKVIGNPTIALDNTNFDNKGQLDAGNLNFCFMGNNNVELISNGNSLFNLDINKTAGAHLTLMDNLSISNELKFSGTDNKIFLGPNNLSFQSTTIITGADPTNYLVTDGTGVIEVNNLSYFSFPVGADANGYNPISITQNGVADAISLRCLSNVFADGASGPSYFSKVVDTSWEIGETLAGGSQIDLTIHWNDTDELTGFDRSNCSLEQYNGSDWMIIGTGSSTGSNPYQFSQTSISGLGVFAMSSGGALPVELIYFEVYKKNNWDAMLDWQTATEQNASHFNIERSWNATTWETIGQVEAKGDSHQTLTYEFIDKQIGLNIPKNTWIYYRLKQIDRDGQFEYSPIRSIYFEKSGGLSIFPNPTKPGSIWLKNTFATSSTLTVFLFNAQGKLLEQFELPTGYEDQDLLLPFPSDIPAGTYLLRIEDKAGLIHFEKVIFN